MRDGLGLIRAWVRPRPRLDAPRLARPPDRPERVAHPFAMDVPVRSYLDQAFPLSIVQADPRHRAALIGGFVQLFFPEDKKAYDRVLLFPSLRTADWERLGLLETRRLDPHASALRSSDALIDTLTALLAGGDCVELQIDEFHLPGRPCFQQIHSVHDNMLVGYDWPARTFLIAGYGRDYELASVDMMAVVRAFHDMPRNQMRRRLIRAIRPGRRAVTTQAGGELATFRTHLRDYLDSRASLSPRDMKRARLYRRARRFQGRWGLAACGAMADYLSERARRREPIDLRVTRTLWEHKICMRGRLAYLEAAQMIRAARQRPEGSIAAAYAEVETLAQAIRFGAFEYNASGCDPAAVEEASAQLAAIQDRERDLLSDITFVAA